MGNKEDTIIHIGKGGITDALEKQTRDALAKREIIKGKVLENSELTAREACDILCKNCLAEPVQVIGSKFIIYKENRDMKPEKKIKLVRG